MTGSTAGPKYFSTVQKRLFCESIEHRVYPGDGTGLTKLCGQPPLIDWTEQEDTGKGLTVSAGSDVGVAVGASSAVWTQRVGKLREVVVSRLTAPAG